MIYLYHLECKKGCKINYIIETDVKDLPKRTKPSCPVCNKRIYQNDERTEFLGPEKVRPKYLKGKKKSIEEEVAKRKKAKRKKKA